MGLFAFALANMVKPNNALVVANRRRLTWGPKTMQAVVQPFFATVLPHSA
jgi:hypothetical protein